MIDPTADLLTALNEVMTYSPSTLSYLSGSTPLSCSVYQSYDTGTRYGATEFDYQKQYTDLSVMAKTSDIENWGLEPKKSIVYLDNTKYLVGGMINKNAAYMFITLRAWLSNG